MLDLTSVSVSDQRPAQIFARFGNIWIGAGNGVPSNDGAPTGSHWFRADGSQGTSHYCKVNGSWVALA